MAYTYAIKPNGNGESLFIQNIIEEKQIAISKGYTRFLPYSFEFEPTEENVKTYGRAPKMYGDLWLFVDAKGQFVQALELFRNFLSICESKHNYFEVEMLRYFIKGASGFCICIPAKIFGGEEGYPHLNILHSLMISRLAYFTYENISRSYVDILNYIDRRELRKPIEEVIRGCKILLPDSSDSTEITPEIFFNEYPQLLTSLCGGDNTSQIHPNPSVQIEMKIYLIEYRSIMSLFLKFLNQLIFFIARS